MVEVLVRTVQSFPGTRATLRETLRFYWSDKRRKGSVVHRQHSHFLQVAQLFIRVDFNCCQKIVFYLPLQFSFSNFSCSFCSVHNFISIFQFLHIYQLDGFGKVERGRERLLSPTQYWQTISAHWIIFHSKAKFNIIQQNRSPRTSLARYIWEYMCPRNCMCDCYKGIKGRSQEFPLNTLYQNGRVSFPF